VVFKEHVKFKLTILDGTAAIP